MVVSSISGQPVEDPPAMDESEGELVRALMHVSGCSDSCGLRMTAWSKVRNAFVFAIDHRGKRYPIVVPSGERPVIDEHTMQTLFVIWAPTSLLLHQEGA